VSRKVYLVIGLIVTITLLSILILHGYPRQSLRTSTLVENTTTIPVSPFDIVSCNECRNLVYREEVVIELNASSQKYYMFTSNGLKEVKSKIPPYVPEYPGFNVLNLTMYGDMYLVMFINTTNVKEYALSVIVLPQVRGHSFSKPILRHEANPSFGACIVHLPRYIEGVQNEKWRIYLRGWIYTIREGYTRVSITIEVWR